MAYRILPIEQRDYLFVSHLDRDLRGADAWSVGQIMEADANLAILLGVFDDEDILVGYIIAQSVLDEAEIHLVGVDEMHQHQGLAGRLMDAAMDALALHGVKSVFLEVRQSNAPAIALYKKCGFEEVGTRKGYYAAKSKGDQKEDALIMKVTMTSYQPQKI